MASSNPRPFVVKVPPAVLNDLKARLKKTRFPDEAQGTGWAYGVDLEYMRTLVDYWLHQYDWRRHETYLNMFAQFIAKVDGVRI